MFREVTQSDRMVVARLGAYATAAAAALAAPSMNTAEAAVITNPINLTIPNNVDGVYLNFVTGSTASAAFTGWDWNPYLQNSVLTFFWNNTAPSVSGGVATAVTGGTYIDLPAGTVVGPASVYSATSGGGGAAATSAFWGVTGTHTLGVKFYNDSTLATNYGYVTIETTASSGFPAKIVSYSYDNTGAAITVPDVPEPATAGVLGLLSIGALGMRKWRKNKAN